MVSIEGFCFRLETTACQDGHDGDIYTSVELRRQHEIHAEQEYKNGTLKFNLKSSNVRIKTMAKVESNWE